MNTPAPDNSPSSLAALRRRLLDRLGDCGSVGVLLSGGVDSAVVAKAAFVALGEKAVAITGVSASLASAEFVAAQHTARTIGLRHIPIQTGEQDVAGYRQNGPDRCFHCKSELYTRAVALARELDLAALANGANADDAGDHRPGMRAATDFGVISPLREVGVTKEQTRALARSWDLDVADKPAAPCLASRVAYGEEVTPERLAMIEAAERFLHDNDLWPGRVRYQRGDLARVEVAIAALPRLVAEPLRNLLVERLTELGFKFVTVDLAGFRSGSLNALVPLEAWEKSRIAATGMQAHSANE